MHHFRSIARSAVTCALAGALVLQGTPTIALGLTSAELQQQLNTARAELDSIGSQVMAAGEELYETQFELEQTEGQITEVEGKIDQKKVELQEAQQILSDRVASNYKSGGVGLASILLQAENLEDIVSSIYYASKVYESDAEAINNVKTIRASLEEDQNALEEYKSAQEDLLTQQTEQMEALEAKEAEQKAYVDNLNAEVAAKLEEERQAEIERQRREAEEAARLAAEAAKQQEQQVSNETTETTTTTDTSYSYTETPNAPTVTSSGSGSLTAAQRNTILAAAYSQIGVPYSFGACNPGSGFDCSGFTMWCYSQAGVSLPHSAASQSYVTSDVAYSDLQPGDLVFWIGTGDPTLTGNHVAMYIGGGNIIHAVWSGVTTQALYSGVTKYGRV